MKTIFYHKDFTQDLSDYKITIVEENSWFTDSFFSSYSFPYQTPIDEWDKNFNPIYQHNSIDFETSFDDGKLFLHGDMYSAKMEIEEHQGDYISQHFQFGIESFPAFEKKLDELPLEVIQVDNIYEHFNEIKSKTYPEVNYNFPLIHTDKYSTSDETFKHYLGSINYCDNNGDFLINKIEAGEVYNYTILQPVPYLLYILKLGFETDGYELKGDILTNNTLKKTLLYKSTDYFSENQSQEFNFKRSGTDYTNTRLETHGGVEYQVGIYSDQIKVDQPGDYKICRHCYH